MKTTKITIRNLFGIRETEIDGQSVELTGANGTGKTSVIDAIRYALTNKSDRDFIVRRGENEGEILIETDTGLSIRRKKRTNMSDYKKITENEREIVGPEAFLQQLFTPLQLNPVEFLAMSKQDQNRAVLDLIDFQWDLNWIMEKFGEIPQGVDYSQNILQVLFDIQRDSGEYFQRRQEINRDIRNRRAFIAEIAQGIPEGYQAAKWDAYDLSDVYRRITEAERVNGLIQRARMFVDSYANKVRGIEADCELAKGRKREEFAVRKNTLIAAIADAEAKIEAWKRELSEMDTSLAREEELLVARMAAEKAKLGNDLATAEEYANKTPFDVSGMTAEAKEAEAMKKLLNEFKRMKQMQAELEAKEKESEALTDKIELARSLPGEILATAQIPVDGLTVENGIPLVHGLPISNLSEGEKLDLCIEIAISRPNSLQLILLDGTEKLSDANRERLYRRCKEKGLQFIATRTTNANEMEVTVL